MLWYAVRNRAEIRGVEFLNIVLVSDVVSIVILY